LEQFGLDEETLKLCSPQELAVMQPPFADRLDRTTLNDDGTIAEPMQRAKTKRDFDKQTFTTKYF
jgi:hypothetical protein